MPSQTNNALCFPGAGGMSKAPVLPSVSWLPLEAFGISVSGQPGALAG